MLNELCKIRYARFRLEVFGTMTRFYQDHTDP